VFLTSNPLHQKRAVLQQLPSFQEGLQGMTTQTLVPTEGTWNQSEGWKRGMIAVQNATNQEGCAAQSLLPESDRGITP
jgi:hypothetical protein